MMARVIGGAKKKSAKRGRKPLSKQELERRKLSRKFKSAIASSFKNAGFLSVKTQEKNITLQGITSEIDSIFVYENLVVVAEDTTLKDCNDHLRKKAEFYDLAIKNEQEFSTLLRDEFSELPASLSGYDPDELILRFMYFSLHPIDESYRSRYPHVFCVPGTGVRYFNALSRTLRKSSRFELFKLLDIPAGKIGHNPAGHGATHDYDGFVLSGAKSGLGDYKLVSFYVDPRTLLETSYVLRRDSWDDKDGLYQRMLIKSKLSGMRKYLAEERRVYVNNVIVSLDNSIKFYDSTGAAIPITKLKGADSVKIGIPRKWNSVGLIDGQHRVFSYFEGVDEYEKEISELRKKQQLLVTGVVFPKSLTESERLKFEAKLFLEINDKQSRARGDLKQAIETIVSPYTSTAIAKSVISRLSKSGALAGLLDDHFFGDGKIKTTSIVSYALKHLVVIRDGAPYTLFGRWSDPAKNDLLSKSNLDARQRYVDYCARCLQELFNAYKNVIPNDLWTTERKVSRALTTTAINGLIFSLRRLVHESKPKTFDWYFSKLQGLSIDFSPKKFNYKSSNWKDLGDYIYESCFLDK